LPVKRSVQDLLFTLLLIATVGAAVWDAQKWEIKARLFPWAIGFPVLALLAAVLVKQSFQLLRGEPEGAESEAHAPDPVARQRFISIVGWTLGFFAAIWILGFPAGGTLATLAYLKLNAHERWPITLYICVGTALFFDAMVVLLNTPFAKGSLFDILLETGFEQPSVSVIRPLKQYVFDPLFGGIAQLFAR
jgi:hypothetical protein